MISVNRISHCFAALALAGTVLLGASVAQAAMSPAAVDAQPDSEIQTVGCLLGAHVGPVGGCIGGYHHRHCWIDHWGHRVCN